MNLTQRVFLPAVLSALVGCGGVDPVPPLDASALTSEIAATNSGGPSTGSYSADKDFSGGLTFTATGTVSTAGVTNPAPEAVYQSERWGNSFSYAIPGLTPGAQYSVRLHFAEIYFTASGQRVFNVAINGSPVLTHFDIVVDAGGAFKATVKSFMATANSSGDVVISFTSVVNNAKISGLEIQSTTNARSTIVNNRSGLCLGANGSKSGGATIEQLTCNSSNDQQFTLVPVGTFFQFADVNSGLCLRPQGGGTAPNTTLVQDACSASDSSQQYSLTSAAAGVYYLVNNKSGLCVTDRQDLQTSGNPQELYTCIQSDSQAFRVSAASGPPSNLRYSVNPLVATQGTPITPDTPSWSGGAPTLYSAASLPSGLSINTATGAITGTPTTSRGQTGYTVTAKNSSGSTQVMLTVTVNPSTGPTWQNYAKQVNGRSWTADFRPFSATSPWNTQIPSNPRLWSESASTMASVKSHLAGGTLGGAFVENTYMHPNIGSWCNNNNPPAGMDYGHPVYFATSSDPLVTFACDLYCGGTNMNSGVQFRIPKGALPAGGCDSHLVVVQPDGTLFGFWGTAKPAGASVAHPTPDGTWWHSGDTFHAKSGTQTNQGIGGEGFVPWQGGNSNSIPCQGYPNGCNNVGGGSETASGAAGAGGQVQFTEIQQAIAANGSLAHALFLTGPCSDPSQLLWPATHGDTPCPFQAVPYGGRVWLDYDDTAINGFNLQPWEKVILRTLHQYGAIFADTGGGTNSDLSVNLGEAWSNYVAYGNVPPWYSWASQNGFSYDQNLDRFFIATPWAPNVPNVYDHLHIVDPCVIRGNCG